MHTIHFRLALTLLLALLFNSCKSPAVGSKEPHKVESVIFEERLHVAGGNLEDLPFQMSSPGDLRIEVVSLKGDPVRFAFLATDDLKRLRVSREISIYSALSKFNVDQKFDSGWHSFPEAGRYSAIIWKPKSPQDENAKKKDEDSIVNVRIVARR